MELNRENYIELKELKKTRKEIAESFNIPEWKLKRIISAEGWSKRPNVENKNAFSEYTEDSCYWAGFIAADGCVSNKGLTICLSYDDLNHLEKFRNFMYSNHKISTNISKYYRCELSFKVDLVNEDLLNNFNVTPNKSLTYKMPIVPKQYFRHFLRGYFDGDGCICETIKPRSVTASLLTTITGSKLFIDELKSTIEDSTSITGGWIQEKANCAVLNYNTNNSLILLDFMYKDSNFSLDRKYSLYDKILLQGNRKTR